MPYSVKDGRIWVQLAKFQPYELLLPYGMTNVTDPTGGLTAVREPSAERHRQTVVVDILRGEPGLPEFQIETRMRKTLNYLFGLRERAVNFQCIIGESGRPDNFYDGEIGLAWDHALRGDLSIDRVASIEGDNAPNAVSVPFSAKVGPTLLDYNVKFLSARTITETQDPNGIAFLRAEYFHEDQSQEDIGENGYAVFGAGSGAVAKIFYTADSGDNWTECSANPFAADEDITAVIAVGKKTDHRVIVSRGTPDGSNPAEIAYADVTTLGTMSWVTVNVGSVNGQQINSLLMLDFLHIYAVTQDGYIYISKDGGASWTLKDSSAGVSLNVIRGVGQGENAGMIVAVGDGNTVLRSMDYGETWSADSGPSAGSGDAVEALLVTPDGTIVIGNDAGELYGSFDLASSWTVLTLQGVTPTIVNDIVSYGDSIIWVAVDTASGGRVLRSVDGGATFRLWDLSIPTNGDARVLTVIDPNIVFAGCTGSGLYDPVVLTRTTSQIVGL
jgi:photosystem II stability/assembly factor-like uncharacterized protein